MYLFYFQYCFKNIRKAFEHFDKDNSQTIDYDELVSALHELGIDGVRDDILKQIFDESDISNTKQLSFKGFLVALALIYLLNVF